MFDPALRQIREASAQVPYIAHINNQDDYERALELMDELIDDYETSDKSTTQEPIQNAPLNVYDPCLAATRNQNAAC